MDTESFVNALATLRMDLLEQWWNAEARYPRTMYLYRRDPTRPGTLAAVVVSDHLPGPEWHLVVGARLGAGMSRDRAGYVIEAALRRIPLLMADADAGNAALSADRTERTPRLSAG